MRLLYFLFLIFVLVSCTAEDDVIGSFERNLKFNYSYPFKGIVKITDVSNGHQLSNLLVGDTLTVNFTINSNHLVDSSYFVGKLTLDGGENYHQYPGVDYDFYYNGKKLEAHDSLILKPGIASVGKIVIKEPGSFSLRYHIRDYIKHNNIGYGDYTDDLLLSFNAIKLYAYQYYWKYDDNDNFFHRDKFRTLYKLYIDMGSKLHDGVYVGNKAVAEYSTVSYTINALVNRYSIDFSDAQEWKEGNFWGHSEPYSIYSKIDKLSIKSIINGEEISSDYFDIPVINYKGQDDWKDEGKNNWYN